MLSSQITCQCITCVNESTGALQNLDKVQALRSFTILRELCRVYEPPLLPPSHDRFVINRLNRSEQDPMVPRGIAFSKDPSMQSMCCLNYRSHALISKMATDPRMSSLSFIRGSKCSACRLQSGPPARYPQFLRERVADIYVFRKDYMQVLMAYVGLR